MALMGLMHWVFGSIGAVQLGSVEMSTSTATWAACRSLVGTCGMGIKALC